MNKSLSKSIFSYSAIILVATSIIAYNLILGEYKIPKRIIESDVINYYSFLPAAFIEKDLSFKFTAKNELYYSQYYWLFPLENGNLISKVTIGMSIMYSPFFISTFSLLDVFDIPSQGFTWHYRLAILVAALFYSVSGLLILQNLLKKYISDFTIAITILMIGLGTNLFYYSTREAGMSHIYSFFTINLLMYLTNKFFKKPTGIISFLLGMTISLIFLIRPTNVFVFLIIPFWGITSFKELKDRFIFFFKSYKYTLLFISGVVFLISPQLFYWKIYSDQWFFNGYKDGAHFFFNNPQVINSLFSFRKGWFLYTPVMILSIPGLVILYVKYRRYFWTTFLIMVLSIYLNSSWWLWWFGGSFGNRAYVDFYGVFAFPIAGFLYYFFEKRGWLSFMLISLITIVFVGHNFFQMLQYKNSVISMSGMTKEAYIEGFGKLHQTSKLKVLFVQPNYKLAAIGIYPKPLVKVKNKNEWIKFFEVETRQNHEMMKLLRKKAIEENISIDSVVKHYAIWCYEHDILGKHN